MSDSSFLLPPSAFIMLAWCLSPWLGSLRGAELPRFIEPDERTGSSKVVIVGDGPLVHTAQLLPVDDEGKIVGPLLTRQADHLLDRLDGVLRPAQSALGNVVKLNIHVARQELVPEVWPVLARRFAGANKPAVTMAVTRLPLAEALVAVDAVATTRLDPGRGVKLLANPGPRGVSQSVAVVPGGTRIYVAGQAERGGSLAESTRKTIESLRATLRFLGRTDADIVQLKAFLTPMADAELVQGEIASFFGQRPSPPTVFFEWRSSPELPIEIELVAWGGMNHAGEVIEYLTPPGMTASPVYSRVTRIHHARSIYVSGLWPPAGGDPGSPDGAAQQVRGTFTELESRLNRAGSDLRHLVKATYYVTGDQVQQQLGALRRQYYDPHRPPAASLARVGEVSQPEVGLSLDMIAVPATKEGESEYGPPEYGHGLSADEAAAGWISLFDGRTTFGWSGARVIDGQLEGGVTTTHFGNCELRAHVTRPGTMTIGGQSREVLPGEFRIAQTAPKPHAIEPIRLGDGVALGRLAVRPLGLESLFNGRDMTGWQRIDHPKLPASNRTQWQVAEGVLHAVGGPGCVEYQDRPFGDLVLQVDVRTRVRHANGGVFVRAIPGDFMNGYEVQVFNRSEDGDPARPARWCTGGIDDRQNARRMVSRDRHRFRMTVIARGPHIATWVNGHQQTDWTDDRPAHVNPRQGRRDEPGALQLQAHDPGTDVEFGHIAAAAW